MCLETVFVRIGANSSEMEYIKIILLFVMAFEAGFFKEFLFDLLF